MLRTLQGMISCSVRSAREEQHPVLRTIAAAARTRRKLNRLRAAATWSVAPAPPRQCVSARTCVMGTGVVDALHEPWRRGEKR